MNTITDIPPVTPSDKYLEQVSKCSHCDDPIWRYTMDRGESWSPWWHGTRPHGGTRPHCYATTVAEP